MDRNFILGFILFVSLPGQANFWGGLTDLASYQSAIPCHSMKTCRANKGIMGYAIDRASESGLGVVSISEGRNEQITVITQQYGRCLINSLEVQKMGEFTFLCVLKDKSKRVFSLEDKNGKLALVEKITKREKGI